MANMTSVDECRLVTIEVDYSSESIHENPNDEL